MPRLQAKKAMAQQKKPTMAMTVAQKKKAKEKEMEGKKKVGEVTYYLRR